MTVKLLSVNLLLVLVFKFVEVFVTVHLQLLKIRNCLYKKTNPLFLKILPPVQNFLILSMAAEK